MSKRGNTLLDRVISASGKNIVCEQVKDRFDELINSVDDIFVKINLDNKTSIVCFPTDVVEYFLFSTTVNKLGDDDRFFNKKIQNKVSQLKRFDEGELNRLKEKFPDDESVLKSPCIVFVKDGDVIFDVYNLKPADVLYTI